MFDRIVNPEFTGNRVSSANIPTLPQWTELHAAWNQMQQALSELIAEFDHASTEAAQEPGHFGLRETAGIVLAREALARVS